MRHTTLAKHLLFNLVGLVLLGFAWRYGYLQAVWEADASRLVAVIGVVFVWSNGEALARLLRSRWDAAANLGFAANVMVTLGLIGTVIGFIVALSGVDPDSVGNVEAIGPMVASLIDGMGIALYTTLVGSVCGLWTAVNQRILES